MKLSNTIDAKFPVERDRWLPGVDSLNYPSHYTLPSIHADVMTLLRNYPCDKFDAARVC